MGDTKDISLHCVKIHKHYHMSKLWHLNSPQVQKSYDYITKKQKTKKQKTRKSTKTNFCFQTGDKIIYALPITLNDKVNQILISPIL